MRERTERGVYAASAWHIRCDVVDFPEPRESETVKRPEGRAPVV